MKRRSFVMLTSAGAASVFIPTLTSCNTAIEYDQNYSVPDALSRIWDEEEIDFYGNEYLIKYPAEDGEQKLVKLLTKGVSEETGDFTKSLVEKIKSEFDQGDTVMLDGWVLSRTEARQCALYTILKSK